MKSFKKLLVFFLIFLSMIMAACSVLADKGESVLPESSGLLKVTFIDVDQGDSVLVQFPNGKSMLIDGGSGDMYGRVAAVLSDQKITKLDVVLGTHTDNDHIGSLPGIIKNYDVGNVYLNGTSDTKTYLAFLREAANKKLKIKELYQGDFLQVDPDVKIKVFAPVGPNEDSDNDHSPIMKLTYQKKSFLFTGDAEKSTEDMALVYDKMGLKSDVVKVGHHGSTTSSSPKFALAVAPELAVIEVGADNSYDHPDKLVVNRWQLLGAKVYTTAKNGNITVTTDGTYLKLFAGKNLEELPKIFSDDKGVAKTIGTYYVGNKNTLVFHDPECSSVAGMNVKNKVLFPSRKEAFTKGYKPCQICTP
ncbi:MBL fold metallo-hydrolase [Dehalobacterium formicoaceticum]|uniref:MBL fold metallo-hydrolase n=1 Tax=Dehalobacterium formicoaceticum TaxID=51515 RepID=A0ABT1Y8H9_9FIRM|nr:MBL fold metallo-hydrolase [Dehalobacterium formicoaceticum]MCR6546863.1 MBL fold metallo-hydrolase [Dehalobacterium formicoaceticum]